MRKLDKTRHRKRLAEKACKGKRQYPDGPAAISAAIAISKTKQEKMRAYACPYCSCWHVGHWQGHVL